MTILLQTATDPRAWLLALGAAAPERPVLTKDAADHFAEVRYAMVWRPPQGLLAQLPNLAVIFNLGAGVDALLADATIPKHIPIVRSVDPDITGRMTEWVVLQALYHFRQMPAYQAQQHRRLWQDLPQQAASAATVGLMGVGVLGQSAAKVLRALGFNVIGWSRTAKRGLGFPVHHGEPELADFLAATDLLVCLLPLTAETTGILNYGLFQRLKRSGPIGGPVLINCGRGGQQVEMDILRALDDNTLVSATLDVFETEPLPVESPLWRHPKVMITPHVAADSDPEAMTAHVLGQIARFEAGRPMETVVDRATGY